MSTLTTNYGFVKPELSDIISPSVFADNFESIDTTIKNAIDTINLSVAAACKMTVGTYTGTGGYGVNNQNSLTFDFAPKFVWIFAGSSSSYIGSGFSDGNGSPICSMVYCNALTTEYAERFFPKMSYSSNGYTMSKKSSDGKMIYWYHSFNEQVQANVSGITYYYLALG